MIYRFKNNRTEGPTGSAPWIDRKAGQVFIATLGDELFVWVPEGVEPPDLPGIAPVEPDEKLAGELRDASPLCRRIARDVVAKIRARFSVDDELGLLRVGRESVEFLQYNDHVEACREWGRAERAKIGL